MNRLAVPVVGYPMINRSTGKLISEVAETPLTEAKSEKFGAKYAKRGPSRVPAPQGPFRRIRQSADTNFESSRDG